MISLAQAAGRRSSIRLQWRGTVVATVEHGTRQRRWCASKSRQVLLTAAAAFAIVQAALAWRVDGPGGWRDPEYTHRLQQCRARLAQWPHRPLVILLGNSRTAMGICPAAWEAEWQRPEALASAPLLFNFGVVGAGPRLQELIARRLLQDGLRPALLLWEYWPPFCHEDEQWDEYQRIEPDRLAPRDLSWVDACYPADKAAQLRWRIWQQHLLPAWGTRQRLLLHLAPDWLPRQQRIDWTWKHLDEWGWYPGLDASVLGEPGRHRLTEQCREIYEPLLARYRASAEAEAALRRGLELLRQAGVPTALLYLPEAPSFRRWYPPHIEARLRQQQQQWQRELNISWLDAREWMTEADFVDGFHLSRQAAAVFTPRLGRVVLARFFPQQR